MSRSALPWTAVLTMALLAPAHASPAQGPVVPRPRTPPASNTQIRDLEYVVTLQGCIHGRRLTVDPSDGATRRAIDLVEASEFTLEGPKELLQQLQRDHEGHQDEITGTVIVPGGRQREGDVTIRDVGSRTRIVAGGSKRTSDDREPDQPKPKVLRLKLASLAHVDDKCHVVP